VAIEILKRTVKTPILQIAPETGRLPESMGDLARHISGKSGGLGEVVAALFEGLAEKGIESHLAILDLKRRFQKEGGMEENQWHDFRDRTDPARIHLISSSFFDDLQSAYGGNVLLNAVEFQRQIINHVITTIRAKHEGRLILHSHDWMAGGAITAYAKSRNWPILHTVHNVHTGHTPVEMYACVNIEELSPNLYFSQDKGKTCIDCQATAIKNASLVNFVGDKFLREILDDYFLDIPITLYGVRWEVKEKFYHGSTLSIMNAPSKRIYPEQCLHLARQYGSEDEISVAKKENLVEFQKRTGLLVNPQMILLYWPSRLDPAQKGIELLEDIALKFVIEHGDVQIAVVEDGISSNRSHEEIMGRIACASGGKIAYQHFSESLSLLGYAAASDVFGASLYEPCGQIDQVGNLYGATATNRDTGGYHDKITELRLQEDGFACDEGNGFLFRDYDAGGLWYGVEKSVRFHRRPPEIRERQLIRIMKETRVKHDPAKMIDRYVSAYEKLNGGVPLT
jgi:glycogen synthase